MKASALTAAGVTVCAEQVDPLAPWHVWIRDSGQPGEHDRWLLEALGRLLDIPARGRTPAWLYELRDELASVETELGRRFPCPCCDNLTLTHIDASEICPVCAWEDSLPQYRHPDLRNTGNSPSLREARANYQDLRVSFLPIAKLCRAPLPAEIPRSHPAT